ncbi:MAG TPA: four helix bundle protein [Patescibacteria group bacterium]|nr:four helix bundle protein [Patescibacteria group bacterium]
MCKKLPKHDRFGVGKNIEDESLGCLKKMIEAALTPKGLKRDIIQKARIKIEILKKLITLLEELKIIDYKKCMDLQNQLQVISKMTYKWIVSISPQKEQEAPE